MLNNFVHSWRSWSVWKYKSNKEKSFTPTKENRGTSLVCTIVCFTPSPSPTLPQNNSLCCPMKTVKGVNVLLSHDETPDGRTVSARLSVAAPQCWFKAHIPAPITTQNKWCPTTEAEEDMLQWFHATHWYVNRLSVSARRVFVSFRFSHWPGFQWNTRVLQRNNITMYRSVTPVSCLLSSCRSCQCRPPKANLNDQHDTSDTSDTNNLNQMFS